MDFKKKGNLLGDAEAIKSTCDLHRYPPDLSPDISGPGAVVCVGPRLTSTFRRTGGRVNSEGLGVAACQELLDINGRSYRGRHFRRLKVVHST